MGAQVVPAQRAPTPLLLAINASNATTLFRRASTDTNGIPLSLLLVKHYHNISSYGG
jgi:hypothetical protein